MDVLQHVEHFFMNVLPVATPIIVAWFSYKLPKKSKEQTDQIISELSEVKKQIKMSRLLLTRIIPKLMKCRQS